MKKTSSTPLEFTEPPEVEVTLDPDGIHLVFVNGCPHCGKKHFHGRGRGPQPIYGHRLAHCRPKSEDNPGYILVPSRQKQNSPDPAAR